MQFTLRNQNHLFFKIILLIGLAVVILLIQNLNYSYLWFDEASQFFISKGLNPDSSPLMQIRGWKEVMINNRYYNFDPGGFSILLHYWSKVSNNVLWLRVLPFGFFLAMFYFIYKTLRSYSNNAALLLALMIIVCLSNLKFLDLAFEIRPYSMEFFGTGMALFLVRNLSLNYKRSKVIVYGIILAILCTSRYSLLIVVFYSSLYFLWLIKNKETGNTFTKVVVMFFYALPFLIILTYIYTKELYFQNQNLQPLHYLPYLGENPNLILKPFNLLFFIWLTGLTVMYILQLMLLKFKKLEKFQPLWFISIASGFTFFILSFLKIHPWSLYTFRCFGMLIPHAVLLIIIITSGISKVKLFNSFFYKSLLLTAFICFVIFNGNHLSVRVNKIPNTFTNFYVLGIEKNKIAVDRSESPSVRYLFEFGELKDKQHEYGYPQNFTFFKGITHNFDEDKISIKKWREDLPSMNSLTEYDLLITPELYKLKSLEESSYWKLIENTNNFWIKKIDAN